MKYIYNSIIPPRGFKAITLWPFVFVRENCKNRFSWADANHEAIHGKQEKEMLILPFLLWYLIEYGIRILQYRNRSKAYHNIGFEREAYANQSNMSYLKTRKQYSWIKYLRQ